MRPSTVLPFRRRRSSVLRVRLSEGVFRSQGRSLAALGLVKSRGMKIYFVDYNWTYDLLAEKIGAGKFCSGKGVNLQLITQNFGPRRVWKSDRIRTCDQPREFENPFPTAHRNGRKTDREVALPTELHLAKHKNEIMGRDFALVNSIYKISAKIFSRLGSTSFLHPHCNS